MAPSGKLRAARWWKQFWADSQNSQQPWDPSLILQHFSMRSIIAFTLKHLIVTQHCNFNYLCLQCEYTQFTINIDSSKTPNYNPKIIFTLFHQFYLLLILVFNKIRRYIISKSPTHDFAPIRIMSKHPKMTKIKPQLRVAWRKVIAARQFNRKNPEWCTTHTSPSGQECAARRFHFSNPKKRQKLHAPPGGDEQPARRFLEIFQKYRKMIEFTGMHLVSYITWYIIERQSELTFTAPLTWFSFA